MQTATVHPDDVLVALLTRGIGINNRMVGTSPEIHKAVYKLKQKHQALFEDFVFTHSTAYPYSDQLATSIRNLQWSRLIGMENPDFKVYFVKPMAGQVFDRVAAGLPQGTLDELGQAADEFARSLQVAEA